MYSSSCNLKKVKSRGILKNSTETCTVNFNNGESWSYKECIAFIKGNYIIFNDYKFSRTTSGHQHAIRSELRGLFPSKVIIEVEVESLNNIRNVHTLKEILIFCAEKTDSIGTLDTLLTYGLSKKLYNENIKRLNLSAKINSLYGKYLSISKKLSRLDYKNIKTITKAYNDRLKYLNEAKALDGRPASSLGKISLPWPSPINANNKEKLIKLKPFILENCELNDTELATLERLTLLDVFESLGD